KANLAQREPETVRRWEETHVYERLLAANAGRPRFVLHDGPPYANGHIHLGTALNKVLKDIIVKHRAMTGRLAPYVPGWDCHGLPIELNVEKELGRAQQDAMPKSEVRARCRAYGERFVAIQRDAIRRRGVLGDWQHPSPLPAGLAVAVQPEHEYVAGAFGERTLVVAAALVPALERLLGAARVLARFRGAELEGGRCQHPWINRIVPIVLADYVTLETGTGLVHTAPGHGQEDYETGLRYGLEVLAPVDARGRFTAEVPEWAGRGVWEANPHIVEHLRAQGALLAAVTVAHSYPHCWRCKNPVVFRATEQWFIGMERGELRRRALAEIERVRWMPGWGRERIGNMIATRPDWCISRQRDWGVPVGAVYCDACVEAIASEALCAHVAAVFEREGADAWFRRPVGELVPPGMSCPRCGGTALRPETDILDVWFDSGVSWKAVVERRPELGG